MPSHERAAPRQFTLPELEFESDDEFGVDDTLYDLERYVLLVMRLWTKDSPDFFAAREQVGRQIRRLRKTARAWDDPSTGKYILRRLARCEAPLLLFDDHDIYIEGSGVLGSRQPRWKIDSVTSAGLPGLGKRN